MHRRPGVGFQPLSRAGKRLEIGSRPQRGLRPVVGRRSVAWLFASHALLLGLVGGSDSCQSLRRERSLSKRALHRPHADPAWPEGRRRIMFRDQPVDRRLTRRFGGVGNHHARATTAELHHVARLQIVGHIHKLGGGGPIPPFCDGENSLGARFTRASSGQSEAGGLFGRCRGGRNGAVAPVQCRLAGLEGATQPPESPFKRAVGVRCRRQKDRKFLIPGSRRIFGLRS